MEFDAFQPVPIASCPDSRLGQVWGQVTGDGGASVGFILLVTSVLCRPRALAHTQARFHSVPCSASAGAHELFNLITIAGMAWTPGVGRRGKPELDLTKISSFQRM